MQSRALPHLHWVANLLQIYFFTVSPPVFTAPATFQQDETVDKKDSNTLFDVMMGSYEEVEICELDSLKTWF